MPYSYTDAIRLHLQSPEVIAFREANPDAPAAEILGDWSWSVFAGPDWDEHEEALLKEIEKQTGASIIDMTPAQIAKHLGLPPWATVAQAEKLLRLSRRMGSFWWWMAANGTSCGTSRTEKGAHAAARRASNADARRSGGPGSSIAVGPMPEGGVK